MVLIMRQTLFAIMTMVIIVTFHVQGVFAVSILDSKHNLSTSGVGTVKAATETQICVFCHTPHKALSDAPLWNRSMSTASYQLFTSLTLLSPTSPAIQPDGDSRLCLSCHDGTIAVGSVVNIGGSPSTISMQGVGGGGELPSLSPAYVGTDLSGHHPVSIELNSALVVDKNTQCIDGVISWKVCIPIGGALVKLQTTDNTYPYGGVPPVQGVQCTSCHDPHKDPNPPNTAFLRVGDRVNTDQLCTACHTDCYMSCP
jgi:predicted CXXCH cytochrome family protein